MSPLINTIISILMLFFGAVALFTMLKTMGAENPPKLKGYVISHKIAGWIFVLFFLLLFIMMLGKIENFWQEASPRIAIHVALSVALLFLVLLKVIIPRYFPRLGKNLFLLGIVIFLFAFTLIGITAGYYGIWRYERFPYISHSDIQETLMDEEMGKQLFIQECSTCHMIKDIIHSRSKEGWEKVINDMVVLAEPRITIDEATQILNYLTLNHGPKSYEGRNDPGIIERHCLPCHQATEIFTKKYSMVAWTEIVKQMQAQAPEIIPQEMIVEIVNFLTKNQ